MSPQPTRIADLIPAAIAALESPQSLEQMCAAVDRTNPRALEHWTHRIRAMRRYSGADEALRCLLFEVTSRRTDIRARSKSYTGPIRHPGAWLNAQSLTWIAHRKSAVQPKRSNTP